MYTDSKRARIEARIQKMGFHTCRWREDGVVYVSAEHGDDAADFYGEFRGGYPWINPKLEKVAEQNHCYWEWINGGVIGLFES